MSLVQDFKAFAMKGSVVDLAVGVIIGGAFGKIVASLVSDIIMPPFSLLIGGINFKDLKIILSRTPDGLPSATWNYGSFLQTTFEFLIISFAVFMMIKVMTKLQKKTPAAPAVPPADLVLLAEIRDLLKKQS